ncbi:MAG: DUF2203 domain-containing protein [Candidatus Thermoplasmatota archaeon]|jgi:hypothetical protein|nr:DUF2203 domain-containing protein [Candidatus Thermoplasmatota archaeon]MCL5793692.1 DUF2203 domain-containing protein [Candidatus Thermoplasmatota archaeon]
MAENGYFDLKSVEETLAWLKEKLDELEDLGPKEMRAMNLGDLDSAEEISIAIQDIMEEIVQKRILVRDQSMMTFDFPAVINNMPAYLCWKRGEPVVSHWHYLDEGFDERRDLTGEESIMSTL